LPRPRRYGSAERPLAPTAPARRPPSSLSLSGSAPGRAGRVPAALLQHPLSDATANERLQAALRELLVTFDATRHRIERDLHDGAQQHLAALAIQFGVVGKLVGTPERVAPVLDRIAEQIDEARAQLQMLVDGSFGDTVRTSGLGTALERTAALVGRPVTVTTVGTEHLPDHVALVTYFACHEAIQNATKHAGAAAAIDVDIRTVTNDDGARVEFRVTDDGHGCDQAHLDSGHGMRSLRQRIEEVGGVLDAVSAPGRGTSLTGVIPVRL
jgi:signal transduction histidine kinase